MGHGVFMELSGDSRHGYACEVFFSKGGGAWGHGAGDDEDASRVAGTAGMLSPNADDGASGRGPIRWRRRPSALLLAWITFLLQNRQAAALEPVRLQPLHFLRSVAAGDNVQTMCAVQSGDEVDFSWRKDGQPLSASGHRLVIHSLPTTSILLIKNATVFDAGNYSCVGRNALGQDSVTAQLRVEDAVEEPPGPRWQGAGETSIELSSVSRQDVGTYRCRADNGLGQISADIQLVVRGEYAQVLANALYAGQPSRSHN
ncbi:hypothetical protein HPB49_001634 [Dermacentor silvarum]|uniref:Uncharacterized protein n=1 Tax=Dermacentor silvarum TaxID=543639 RepID=A0ACB8C6U5_DERSI|nr:hypothetical protein HPB49_001634 [Dermacentor silvarum]